MTGIYCIENQKNGKKYIGQAVDIERRFKLHKSKLRNGKHSNEHLQRAWNKYGEPAFLFYVIELCDKSSLSEKEIYYISLLKTYDNGYNMTFGGEGTRGYFHTDEYKEHMRKLSIGRTFSDETLQKMSDAKRGKATQYKSQETKISAYKKVSEKLKGKEFTDEHKANISKAKKGKSPWNKGLKFPPEAHPMYGKHLSESAKQKISCANKGRTRTKQERLACAKKVLCVDTNELFTSITDAAKKYGVSIYAISNVLRGKSNTCKGLHWKYAEGGAES